VAERGRWTCWPDSVCVCVCICPHGLAAVGAKVQRNSRALYLQSFHRNCRHGAVRGSWTCCPVSVCVCVCVSNMDLLLWARKCCESLVRGSCNNFAVTADKLPCVEHGHSGMSVCVCVCVRLCISNMDLPQLARKCSECLVLGSCNHLAVIADKVPCVVDGLAGLSLCVCVCVCLDI
jgi:hypothetical protein